MVIEGEHPLLSLYGEKAFDLVLKEIEGLKANSNIPFDKEYIQLGVSFIVIKAKEIIEGKRPRIELKTLVSESFGEAAIYKYNV